MKSKKIKKIKKDNCSVSTENFSKASTVCSSKAIPEQKKKNSRVLNFATEKKIFPCEHCDRQFFRSQSLGGHMSKAHPQMSSSYANKVKRRSER